MFLRGRMQFTFLSISYQIVLIIRDIKNFLACYVTQFVLGKKYVSCMSRNYYKIKGYWTQLSGRFAVVRQTTLVNSQPFNSLRPRRNRRHFADDIFKCIFLNENELMSLRISLKFFPKVRINNIPSLVQIMAWRRPGDKPLSEPMVVSLLTHICVTRPQWVKSCISTAVCLYPNHIEILVRVVVGITC